MMNKATEPKPLIGEAKLIAAKDQSIWCQIRAKKELVFELQLRWFDAKGFDHWQLLIWFTQSVLYW